MMEKEREKVGSNEDFKSKRGERDSSRVQWNPVLKSFPLASKLKQQGK